MPPTPRRSTRARLQVPFWEEGTGRLFWDGKLVKWFRQPAVNQRALLTALQRAGWPSILPNPLRGTRGTDRKTRLHETIHALNRYQIGGQVLHFHGDGTGRRLWWEAVPHP
jgi:hypothetical protein